MSDFAQKFRRMSLFLERIAIVGSSYDLDFVRNQLPFLSFTLRRDQRATDGDRCSSCEPLNREVIRQRILRDNLKIAQGRAVIQLDKRKIFGIAAGPHPALHLNRIDWRGALQSILSQSWRKLCHFTLEIDSFSPDSLAATLAAQPSMSLIRNRCIPRLRSE